MHRPGSVLVPEHEIDAGTAVDGVVGLQDQENNPSGNGGVEDDAETNRHYAESTYNDSEESDSSISSGCESSGSSESSAASKCPSQSRPNSDSADEVSDSDSPQDESDESNDGEQCHFGNIPVSQCSSFSVDEAIVGVMDLYIDERMKKKSIQKFLNLVQKFIPTCNNMPKTTHTLFKYVEDLYPLIPEKAHFYCKDCLLYLGEYSRKCPLCNCEQSKKFYQLSLVHQIKALFEQHNLADVIDKYVDFRNSNETDGFSDIVDGSEYQRARPPGRYDLTLLGHLDGVSVSKSSDMSMWALEFVICEIPFDIRFQLVLIAGIWMDNCKPIVTSYLKPFFAELHHLSEEGVSWKHPRTNATENTKVCAPVFCADAPVRAQLQNILAHGGKYCCHACEQKTVKLPAEPVLPGQKKIIRRRVFTFREEESQMRTADRMEHQAQITTQHRQATGKLVPKKGVRGISVASNLTQCDRSTMVYPEYMHLILGIVKQFFVLWFEVDGEWSLKEYRAEIDTFLESLRVPDFLTRTPRSTKSFVKWKANELRSFLLYFSLIILSQFMHEKYLQHWMLLVNGIYLLLQDTVSENDVTRAEVFFKMFLRDFSTLYRAKDFTYNLHQLLHLAITVRRWGPLGCNSAFPLENLNGIIAGLIHGKRYQGKELSNTIRLIQSVQALKARTVEEGQQRITVVEFCNVVKNFKFSSEQQALISNLNVNGPFTAYYRVKIGSQKYTTLTYKRQVKRNNFTVCYTDSGSNKYGEIVCLFEDDASTVKMAFIRCFLIDHLRTFFHSETRFVVKHLIPVTESEELVLVPISNIQHKVIRAGNFVCLRPNKYEVNL